LSTRKSLGWNPDYWFTQNGDHRYRTALFPHSGNWRLRYREAIGFNYRPIAFVGEQKSHTASDSLPQTASFLQLSPSNLVLTAMKKSEDDNRIILRFYEAEGNSCTARVRLPAPVVSACKASIIEDDEAAVSPLGDGTVELAVGPWEIVTLKLAFA
jgi:alpha-mannosidase